uniref:C2 domain-containing protein n=1 Tax=Nothobranchius kadleci TaxID=1051664 RepID=A0A1A8CWG8_NOTKA
MASSLPLVLLLCILGTAFSDLRVSNLRAAGLRPDQNSNADGFVKVFCASTSMGQTTVYHDHPNPSWTSTFTYRRALQGDVLKLEVFDKDVAFDDRLGTCTVRIKKGTFSHRCSLTKGGTLSYTYSLN